MSQPDTIHQLLEVQSNLAEIIDGLREAQDAPDLEAAPWFTLAKGELGTKEVVGPKHNPRVLEYLRTTSLGKWGAGRDETPWCSAFVNWCMTGAGIEGTNNAMARSWMAWGVELEEPREGCVVVFTRGAPPSAHVSLYSHTEDGRLMCLGGNQRNEVCVSPYSTGRVKGYRWPMAA